MEKETSGSVTKVVDSSNIASLGSHNAMLGFDEVEGRWYTGSHYERQVWTFDTASSEWASAIAASSVPVCGPT